MKRSTRLLVPVAIVSSLFVTSLIRAILFVVKSTRADMSPMTVDA